MLGIVLLLSIEKDPVPTVYLSFADLVNLAGGRHKRKHELLISELRLKIPITLRVYRECFECPIHYLSNPLIIAGM